MVICTAECMNQEHMDSVHMLMIPLDGGLHNNKDITRHCETYRSSDDGR